MLGPLLTCGPACVPRQRHVDRAGLSTDEYVAVEMRRDTRVVGHFLVTATTQVAYPDREQGRVAVLLVDQVAATTGRRGGMRCR